ncbi:MAG: DEAD/DEAH box helicase [Ardenticatenaceae bacterium]
MASQFEKGKMVQLRADLERGGVIIDVLPSVAGEFRYRVFHSPTDIRDYHHSQLVGAGEPTTLDVLADALMAGEWLDAELFHARLTAARLAHPETDTLYALHAARIKYIPFQFKPLLRLLRADRPRLLIADEVGVGKTIEAGLILKELQTRQQIDNVLILCPKALVSKWRVEMRRFDEEFHAIRSDTLHYCLKETDFEGSWPSQYARAIVNVELLRKKEYLMGTDGRKARPGLLTLDPAPQFTLLIVDEAHHLRNPGTSTHKLARFLCDVSDAVLFLSATPLHLGSQNLYTLLNLLRPELFPDGEVFDEMLEPNKHLTEALRHIRVPRHAWQKEAAHALMRAALTPWGGQVLVQDARFTKWVSRLQEESLLSDAERIRCMRDLEEVHSLAHIMNRTRRRDIGRFTLREPHTIEVPFTFEQEEFYKKLLKFRQQMLALEHSSQVVRLVVDSTERQAASCLPALLPFLDDFLHSGRFSTRSLTDDLSIQEVIQGLPPYLRQQAQTLRQLAAELPKDDPKLDRLMEIIQQRLSGEGPGKALLFSFYLRTLAYLQQELQATGYRVELVTGAVKDGERESLRARFRLPREHAEAIDILLSSEVGCEGLDYEFCDCLINYDIPWNPMRVEQRIGRIDRFGQEADKVLIFNFITPGTIEERIFFRCYERLGVFRDTIGDMEEVLGQIVQDLTQIALDPTLTPKQAERKARQTADNAFRVVEEQRRLEEESSALFSLDQVLSEEVDTLLSAGKFVSADELQVMVSRFIKEMGGKLSASRDGLSRLRLNKRGREALLEKMRQMERYDRSTTRFMNWLRGNKAYFDLTFDQSTAVEQRTMPFVTPVHALARLAIAHWNGLESPLVSYLSVLSVTEPEIPTGSYLFICDLWESIGVKAEHRLVSVAWNLHEERPAPEISAHLLRLLGGATQPANVNGVTIKSEAWKRLNEEAYRLQQDALRQLQEQNDNLVARKLASLVTYYEKRLQSVESEIKQASEKRILRMKKAEQARIKSDYSQKRREIESRRQADIVSQRIAAGIVEVAHPLKAGDLD